MKQYKPVFKEIPVEKIARDQNQPRKSFGTGGDENRLLTSIKDYGIEEPIKVTEIESERYVIIDGHRRYICAQKLGLHVVPCRVYPKMEQGEFEARRYEMQNNRRTWRPLERAESLNRIKNFMGFKNNQELSAFVHLSESWVNYSLRLRNQRLAYTDLMQEYELSDAYRMEFMKLSPKLRKIREVEVDDIMNVLMEKIQHKVIKNAKDLRTLSRIFMRATANEVELHRFLTNPDATIKELEQRTLQSGFSLKIEQLLQDISGKKKDGVSFSTQEKDFLKQLRLLIDKVV